ncbi:hypothetical protein C1J02_17410 [Sulfitobacter sp. SK011]|nr:hypothetical protein C1J02_17410 [Sulfitobacter sp. SK011]
MLALGQEWLSLKLSPKLSADAGSISVSRNAPTSVFRGVLPFVYSAALVTLGSNQTCGGASRRFASSGGCADETAMRLGHTNGWFRVGEANWPSVNIETQGLRGCKFA